MSGEAIAQSQERSELSTLAGVLARIFKVDVDSLREYDKARSDKLIIAAENDVARKYGVNDITNVLFTKCSYVIGKNKCNHNAVVRIVGEKKAYGGVHVSAAETTACPEHLNDMISRVKMYCSGNGVDIQIYRLRDCRKK